MKRLLVLLVVWCGTVYGQTPFSLDSASAYLHTIAKDIGPRPMGSPNERRAMEFALSKFREFGMTETAILPMTITTSSYSFVPGTNTNSGTAYGILPGKSKRIILLGAHIDSATPDIPGANDDGSGTATIIELARVLSRRDNESTIVFALFGGEEQGLRGSRHFVEFFPRITDVVLMIQVDMTNGSDWLMPLIDGGDGRRSPSWLVEAAYEETSKLGYPTLSYPNHFMSLNNTLPGGGAGSDHMPFLANDIPAIDFTTDLNDPIHTPQDSYDNFLFSGLKRSGDLVYRLVERFDGGFPEEKTGSYYLTQVGNVPLFLPSWLLGAFIVIAVGVSIVALVSLRRRRDIEEVRSKVPGLKLFGAMLVIQAAVWLSENVVGLIKGDRYPWFAHPDGYFLLAFLGGVLGIWVALQLTRRMELSRIAYRYYLRAVVFLFAFLVITLLGSIHLALYPAFALFFLGLAVLVRQRWVRMLLWLISPYFMYRLIFSEAFGLASRATSLAVPDTFIAGLFLHLAYILFFSLWAFPFLLGFAAVYFDFKSDPLALQRFRTKWGGLGAVAAFMACVVVLAFQPTLSPYWNQSIRIDQELDLEKGSGYTTVSSPEYLDGVRIVAGAKDTSVTTHITSLRLGDPLVLSEPWIETERTVESTSDTATNFNIMLKIKTAYRPYTLNVSYTTAKGRIAAVSSPYFVSQTAHSAALRWYSFPEREMTIPIAISVVGVDSLSEEIEAVFTQQVVPIEAVKDLATATHRTTVRKASVVHATP